LREHLTLHKAGDFRLSFYTYSQINPEQIEKNFAKWFAERETKDE
jgi:hypothetical protein